MLKSGLIYFISLVGVGGGGGFAVTEERLLNWQTFLMILMTFYLRILDKNLRDICPTLKILSQIKHLMHFRILNPGLGCKEVAQNLHHAGEILINDH